MVQQNATVSIAAAPMKTPVTKLKAKCLHAVTDPPKKTFHRITLSH